MNRYSKYATTVIGAHSVPDWYEALDRLVAVGQLSMAAMNDAQYRATQAAVLDQEIAGIDVVTGGEIHRRTTLSIRGAICAIFMGTVQLDGKLNL